MKGALSDPESLLSGAISRSIFGKTKMCIRDRMRKAKRSYNPVKMIEKYLIRTRDLREEKGIWGKEEA